MQKEEEEPTLRLCQVERKPGSSCGFHLSRTSWDPYPWVSGVEEGSPAELAGLQTGDCVLEVNGEDILGEKISEVASRVRAKDSRVTLLLWNSGSDPHISSFANGDGRAKGKYDASGRRVSHNLQRYWQMSGSGPTPLSLQRLSNCLQSVHQLLECPVCLETVPPPAYQCCHGHILCGNCRARADRCPVCRVSLGSKGRCLLADKLHHLLTTTLNRTVRNKQSGKQNSTKNTSNMSQVNQDMPYIYLKSRMITLHELDAVPYNLINLETNKLLCPKKCKHKTIHEVVNTSGSQVTSDEIKQEPMDSIIVANMQNAIASLEQEPLQPEVPSDEKKSNCTQKTVRRMSEELSPSEREAEIPLRTRSVSAEEIMTIGTNERLQGKTLQSNRVEKLVFHCPYPTKSIRHCQHECTGKRELQQHLQEAHVGPLIQYFIQPSHSVTKLRLPLSSSRSSRSSLISFTMHDGTVFFIQVAIGATPGHRLVWLWLLDDAIQAERYRLRLTMPEGDTHTGPVFSLTSSWTDVVNSNCCLSIEEQRYIRRNPEVQIEILDISKSN